MPISAGRCREASLFGSCRAALLLGLAGMFAGTAAGTDMIADRAPRSLPADPIDARFEIGTAAVLLDGGVAEAPAAPGSAMRVRTQVFGGPVFGDLDGDADDDAALWLVQDPGGSGSFYYVAAAINESGGFRGTSAVLLGDRIIPRELLIEHRMVTVRFARRRPEEPMAATPAVETVRRFTLAYDRLVPAAGPP